MKKTKVFREVILCEQNVKLNKFTTVEELENRRRIERWFIFYRNDDEENIEFDEWLKTIGEGWLPILPDIDQFELSQKEEKTLRYPFFPVDVVDVPWIKNDIKELEAAGIDPYNYTFRKEVRLQIDPVFCQWFYQQEKIAIWEEDGVVTKVNIIPPTKDKQLSDEEIEEYVQKGEFPF